MSATKYLDSIIQRALIALGNPQRRPKQCEAVKLFLEGNDILVVLPTGSGKAGNHFAMICCHLRSTTCWTEKAVSL